MCVHPHFLLSDCILVPPHGTHEKRDTSAEGQEETCKKEVDNLLLNC